MHIDGSRLWGMGNAGYNWSRVTSFKLWSGSAGFGASYLLFYATNIIPSGGPDHRWASYPLRCLKGELLRKNKVQVKIIPINCLDP